MCSIGTALIFPETSSVTDSFIAFYRRLLQLKCSVIAAGVDCTWRQMHRAHERPECEHQSDGQTYKNSPSPPAYPDDVGRCVSYICTRQHRGSLRAKTELWSIDGLYDNLNSSRCGWHSWHLSWENGKKKEITASLEMCGILLWLHLSRK
jgi:hypothetical protein